MDQDRVIVQCKGCGAKNRIPRERLQDGPVCGRCRSPLEARAHQDHPVPVTDTTFDHEVLSHPGAVLVDCWAPWCGPCLMIAPVLDQLALECAGRLKIAKLNVDENPLTASQYSIQSIPTLLLFRAGDLVNRLVGALPKGEIERHVQSIL